MIHCKLTKTCDKNLKFVANMLIQNKIILLRIEWDENLATHYIGAEVKMVKILVYENELF